MMLDCKLNYNIKKDKIFGFKNCGERVEQDLADHAMVFMVRGLKKKWKQPIAYYFSEAGMNTADIARNIKLIIRSLHSIGLQVLATVCDQLSTNTAAINLLKSQTDIDHRIQNQENRMLGFSVDGVEVVPLYDIPHLLKGMRNNFLEADIKFVWKKNKIQVASWKDIVAVYELDIGDFDTKMLNKLTESHVYKEKLKKMKVSYAAQIFSQKVSSIMRDLVKYCIV